MISFKKKHTGTRALFTGLMLALNVGLTGWAGATGDNIPSPDKSKQALKSEIMAFNEAVKELEAYLYAEQESIYEIQQKVRFYDAGFNLVHETTRQEIKNRTAKQGYFRKSDLFMEQKEAVIYMLQ